MKYHRKISINDEKFTRNYERKEVIIEVPEAYLRINTARRLAIFSKFCD